MGNDDTDLLNLIQSQTDEAQKKYTVHGKGEMLTSTIVAFLELCANNCLGFVY